MELNEQNTSGQGINSIVPEEVKNHFNWGAFFLTWIWGIGNNTFITLIIFLCLLLKNNQVLWFIAGLALEIWFGIKGNEWAWRNKKFESVEAFHKYQKKWVKVPFLIFGGFFAICFILGIIVGFMPLLLKILSR